MAKWMLFEKMADHPVHTTPNHHPGLFFKSSLLLNGWCGIQVPMSPNQQRRPLPLYLSSFCECYGAGPLLLPRLLVFFPFYGPYRARGSDVRSTCVLWWWDFKCKVFFCQRDCEFVMSIHICVFFADPDPAF